MHQIPAQSTDKAIYFNFGDFVKLIAVRQDYLSQQI